MCSLNGGVGDVCAMGGILPALELSSQALIVNVTSVVSALSLPVFSVLGKGGGI
jgi:hypothetical protein